jgi:hypothetical protein
MEKVLNITQMETFIKDNSLMVYYKDMEYISIIMVHNIKEILNKDIEMVMEFIEIKIMLIQMIRKDKDMKDILCWIKNMDLGCFI